MILIFEHFNWWQYVSNLIYRNNIQLHVPVSDMAVTCVTEIHTSSIKKFHKLYKNWLDIFRYNFLVIGIKTRFRCPIKNIHILFLCTVIQEKIPNRHSRYKITKQGWCMEMTIDLWFEVIMVVLIAKASFHDLFQKVSILEQLPQRSFLLTNGM